MVPRTRLVDEYRPPEPANVFQLRESAHAFSGAWMYDENFGGDFVDGAPCSIELGKA